MFVLNYKTTKTPHRTLHIVGQQTIILFDIKFFIVIIDFDLNKKTSAIGRGLIVYFKNLKLCNAVLCGIFRHHTTHIAHSNFHFLFLILFCKYSFIF